MKRTMRFLIAMGFVASSLSPISAQAVSSNPSPVCSGSTCTVTFAYTGDYYSWTVPSGITSVTADASGGAGYNSQSGALAGKGGRVQATLSTTPGNILYIYVGGEGGAGNTSAAGVGGWNGGGSGGYYGSSNWGTGGGGASDIRTTVGNLSTRLLVAGGGGGAGCNYCTNPYDNGGAGGGLNGAESYYAASGSIRAGGGTQSSGGAGNIYSNYNGGSSGSLGIGGSGGAGTAGAGGGGGYYGGGGGSWTGGGGGSSFTHASLASSVTHTQGYRAGTGTISITYLNAPSPTLFTTSESSITKTNSSITYSLSFSQDVNSVANSDFSNSGTATGCIFSISASSGSSFTLTVSGCSEGTLVPQVLANSVFGTVTSSNGPAANSLTTTPVKIDRTSPAIASVAAPSSSTYSNNQTPTFTMVFSESITVTGSPRLTLTVGSATKYATFLSLTDSKTATFRYTVGSDPVEFDTDGISVATTVDLNSGAIADLATNAISNLSFTAPTLTSVLVAQSAVAPTIDSVVATSGTLTIYFTAGAARGSTTSGYQYTTDNNTFKNRVTGTTGSPLVITTVSTGSAALVDGTGYQIRLRAVTNAGNSAISNLVNETPTAVSVIGDSTLSLTYGTSASTGSYSATGGTSTYTWSLGSSLTGVTLSGTTVTAGSTTPAGIYSQTLRAADGNSQVGTKTLTITVNKATTSITIALPGSASNAALGGAVTITATVPQAGAVNFMLGGTTISGCGSASASTTTATCSWTPASLGSVSLTATFTPTDSSNFETATTTTLSITVVNGVSTVTLSLTGGTTTPPKGQVINIIAAVDQAGRITFMIDGKRIAGCNNKVANVGNVSCTWKPAVQKQVTITARLVPTNSVYNSSSSSLKVQVIRRTGLR